MEKGVNTEIAVENYLAYRSLALAILGKGSEAEALRWFLRIKNEEQDLLKSRLEN